MAFTMERWYVAVEKRFAVRKYDGPPSDEELGLLEEKARELSVRGVRVATGQDKKAFSSLFAGTGGVKGTDCFAAFIPHDADMRTVGYLGEAFVLECAAMGLGTCWLGLYNKRVVARAAKLQAGERAACIVAIGVPKEEYVQRPRKPLEELTGLEAEAIDALPVWQRCALECARSAPSATNAQPWKFLVEGDTLRVHNTGGNFGFGLLDCGIAMLHMELGAAHGGVAGDWAYEGKDAVFTPVSQSVDQYDETEEDVCMPFSGFVE